MTVIHWPETLTLGTAKRLAREIKSAAQINHSRALDIVAVQYGHKTWNAARLALETDADLAERQGKKMRSQQRRAWKWAKENAKRRHDADTVARLNPGWIGRRTAISLIDPGARPADRLAVRVTRRPHADG